MADDTYIRESILTPQAKLVAGYQPMMPTFQGLVNEEGVMSLIEYIKSLPAANGRRRSAAGDARSRDPRASEGRTMTTTTATVLPSANYLNHTSTVASWLLTKDHKRIGILYLIVVTFAFILGGIFAAGDPASS